MYDVEYVCGMCMCVQEGVHLYAPKNGGLRSFLGRSPSLIFETRSLIEAEAHKFS